MTRVAIMALALALMVAVACSSSSSSRAYDGPRSPCSTGTPYTRDTRFPTGPYESNEPQCALRCGDTSGASWGAGGTKPVPTVSAVPTGACEYEQEACQMLAVTVCPHADRTPPNEVGTLLQFECHCRNRTWECSSAYRSGGGCSPDAGTDAEGGIADAASD
jgi:hypothetical protein